jgi:hypothetical protein
MTLAISRPELDSLPERVARSARERIAHIAALPSASEDCALSRAARELLAYARTGRGGDWSSPASARAALRVVSLGCVATLGEEPSPEDWVDRVDLSGELAEIAEVCRAALARV